MRGKDSVYLSSAALGRLSVQDLTAMERRLSAATGGGKYRREQRDLLARVRTARRRRPSQ